MYSPHSPANSDRDTCYGQGSHPRRRHSRPGRSAVYRVRMRISSGERSRNREGQPVGQSPPHSDGVPPQPPSYADIREAFRSLRDNPEHALHRAEILLKRYRNKPSPSMQLLQLKARALLSLNKTDDCLTFIDSLEKTARNDKGLLMTRGRALQVLGHYNEALLLFQHLYAAHSKTSKDQKIHSLALGRLLQTMGGTDNLERALQLFTRLRARAAKGRENVPCRDKDIELALGRLLEAMGGAPNREKALVIYKRLHTRAARRRRRSPCASKDIELTFARLLQTMGNRTHLEKALAIVTRLRTRAAGGLEDTPCDDKEIELAQGRVLQATGRADNLEKALVIFTRLRTRATAGKVDTPCGDKDIELALGRLLEQMGGAHNLERALSIYTGLRAFAAGKENSPCDDRNIEFTLGRHLLLAGGTHNLNKAWDIFTRLRTRAANAQENTPCDDKKIELTLALLLQTMGGRAHLEQGLGILTRLRALATGGKENGPCDDKDIELALGKHLQAMGGMENLEKALAIFTRLQTQASSGQLEPACDDSDIELALASCFVAMGMWRQFDQLRIDARCFPGFEPHLLVSRRCWQELERTRTILPEHRELLGKALKHAALAVEASGFTQARCTGQLARCFHLLSCSAASLKLCAAQQKTAEHFRATATFLFDVVRESQPHRHELGQNAKHSADSTRGVQNDSAVSFCPGL